MNALDLCRWAVDGRYASSATLGVFPPGPEDYRDGAIIHVNGKEAASRVADRIAQESAGAFPSGRVATACEGSHGHCTRIVRCILDGTKVALVWDESMPATPAPPRPAPVEI